MNNDVWVLQWIWPWDHEESKILIRNISTLIKKHFFIILVMIMMITVTNDNKSAFEIVAPIFLLDDTNYADDNEQWW